MGNCLKSEDDTSSSKNNKKESTSSKSGQDGGETKEMKFEKPKTSEKSWDKMKKNLNKEDFIFRDKIGGEYVKAPGSINGQQFCIENCKDAIIYLCDYSAAISIDDCENCKFYVGPCESSVFVRNTKKCQFVIACQQFRMRDGSDLDIIIFSQTPPIIESSQRIKFGCFKFSYFELQQQFKQINLNIWNNRWSEIHDYTKKTPPNYSYLDEEINPYDLIPKISSLTGGEFSDKGVEEQVDMIVPISLGNRQRLYDQEVLLFVMPGYENACEQFIPKVHKKNKNELFFIKSRSAAFFQDQVPTLFSKEEWKSLTEGVKIQWGKSEFIFINFGGKKVEAQVKELCEELIRDKKAYHIWTDEKKILEHNKIIFEAWREEK